MGRPKGSKNGARKTFKVYCQICNKEFEVEPYQLKTAKYCSRECQHIGHSTLVRRPTHRICLACKKEFTTTPTSKQIYCSKSCSDKEHGAKISGLWADRIEKECPTCLKSFTSRVKENRKFCSKECHDKSMILEKISIKCEFCGKEFSVRPHLAHQRFCSRNCRNSGLGHSSTRIEMGMASALYDAKIPFEPQYPIGWYTLDFAIPSISLAIECDGDYWHSLKDNIKHDKAKNSYLRKHGWSILRFSESEIYQDIDRCVKTIKLRLDASSPPHTAKN